MRIPSDEYVFLEDGSSATLSLHIMTSVDWSVTIWRRRPGFVDRTESNPFRTGYIVTLLLPETCLTLSLSLYSVVSASFEGLSRGNLYIFRTSNPFTHYLFTVVLT